MNRIKDNVVFGSFHYWEASVNELTNSAGLDPVSKIPELKISAVNIVKISEQDYLTVLKEKKEKFQIDSVGHESMIFPEIHNHARHSQIGKEA